MSSKGESLMYAQMGMSVVSAFGAYNTQKHTVKMEEISRKYRETMAGISAAQQLNTMTDNEIAVKDAADRTALALGIQSIQDRGSAEAAAAGAGVKGGSVRATVRGLMRSRLAAREALRMKVQAAAKSSRNERANLALSRVMGKDITPVMKPSATSALLGLGASIIDIYDDSRPEGGKIADTMAGWGRK
jgi:hypothetical protein